MANKREQVLEHVIATGKVSTVRVLENILGVRAANISPERLSNLPEPLSDDPLQQASWKDGMLVRLHQAEAGKILSIHSADTVYKHNGETVLHKPGNEQGRLPVGIAIPEDADTLEPYIQEAQAMYGEPFTAFWANAIIHHVVRRSNRAAVLDVEAAFTESIHPDRVRQIFQPKLNTRIALAEEIKERGIQFLVSNRGRGEKHPIPSDIALQIIIDRVLPLHWYDQLEKSNPNSMYRDKFGRRNVVEIDFTRNVTRE